MTALFANRFLTPLRAKAAAILRFVVILVLVPLCPVASGGVSVLTVTWQPLDGLDEGGIQICQVVCHDWYSHGGQATAIGLISARNVPPTNNPKEATDDLNLASLYGVHFFSSDLGDPKAKLELTLDATKFAVPEGQERPREMIIRACLECLRRCLPEKLRKTPVTLDAAAPDKEWMGKIVREFNKHDRRKVFYRPPQ